MQKSETDFLPSAPGPICDCDPSCCGSCENSLRRGFLEVETPLLSADVTVDRHIDPIGVILADDPRRPDVGRPMWLQTSPEFAMKRLLAAGATAIYQVTRAFRNAERGPLHNPEFTMVEWYRAGDGMEEGIALLSELAEALLCARRRPSG